jgi:hypothetical protein
MKKSTILPPNPFYLPTPSTFPTPSALLVIGQLYRNEYGIPAHPSTTTVPALWVDGLTVRGITLET